MSDSSGSSSENEYQNVLEECDIVSSHRNKHQQKLTVEGDRSMEFMKKTWDLLETAKASEDGEIEMCKQRVVRRMQSDVATRLPFTDGTLYDKSFKRTQSQSDMNSRQQSDCKRVPYIYMSVLIRYLVCKDEIQQFDVVQATKNLPNKIRSCTAVSDNMCFLLHPKCNPGNKCNICKRAYEITKICNLPCHCDVFLKNLVTIAHDCKPGDQNDVCVNDVYLYTDGAPPGYTKLVPMNNNSWPKETLAYDNSSETFYVRHPKRAEMSDSDDLILHGIVCKRWPRKMADDFLHRNRPGGWPSLEVVKEIVKSECCVVSATQTGSRQSDTDWKFVFNGARRILQDTMTLSQKMCLAFFQLVIQHSAVDSNGYSLLKPFHLDTLMFRVSEELPLHVWGPDVGWCFMTLVKRLLDCLECQKLDNYFIPSFNIFANISTANISKLIPIIKNIRDQPLDVVYSIVNKHELRNSGIIHCINACVLHAPREFDLSVTIKKKLTPCIVELSKSYILHNKFEEAFLSLRDFFEMLQKFEQESACDMQNATDFQGFLELTLETEADAAFSFWLMLYARIAHGTYLSAVDRDNTIHLKQIIQCDASNNFLDIYIPKSIISKDEIEQYDFLRRVANLMRNTNKSECYTCILGCIINKIDDALKPGKPVVVNTGENNETDDDDDNSGMMYKRTQNLLNLMLSVLTELFKYHQESKSVDRFEVYYDLYKMACERLGTSSTFSMLGMVQSCLGLVAEAQESSRMAQVMSGVTFGSP